MSEVNDKWAAAAASLPVEVRSQLMQLKSDYEVASKNNVPGWKGDPIRGYYLI